MPVTLQIISDLHLEHRQELSPDQFLTPSANVLALLGDIGSPYDDKLELFLLWCSKKYSHVLYIAGNHEYYSNYNHTYETIKQYLMNLCNKFPNVHFLDNNTFELEDVVFIGSTLWSDIPKEKDDYLLSHMNDYRLIHISAGEKMQPYHSRVLFEQSKSYIEKTITKVMNMNKKIVILTHHAPSFHKTSAPEYEHSDSTFAFASSLPYYDKNNPIRLWCSGHTHFNYHHFEEGYELISNQVGYKKPIKGYIKNLSICL